MTAYATLINPNFAHTFALIVHSTGEVYTSSCDVAAYALRPLYKRMDSLRRESRLFGLDFSATLYNLRTGAVVEEIF